VPEGDVRGTRWSVAGAALGLILAGCASVPDPYRAPPVAAHLTAATDAGACARLLRAVDERVQALGVRDAMAARVAGFPYLRVDRLGAALAQQAADRVQTERVMARLAQLDAQARRVELANARQPARQRAATNAPEPALPAADVLDACRSVLLAADTADPAVLAQPVALKAAAQVADDYTLALRVAGLYPLVKIPFAAGVRGWQRETEAVFAQPLAALPVAGRLVRYGPGAVQSFPQPLAAGSAAAAPLLRGEWMALALRHAPLVVVDTVTPDDEIGRLHWAAAAPAASPALAVDLSEPQATVRLHWTRLGPQLLPQLVYTFWFPARPASGALDLLAGHLDALVWRVTLGPDGAGGWRAWAYDSIHACGCYHQFFATTHLAPRAEPAATQGWLDEGRFMPQPAPLPDPRADERIELRVAARTHYLQRVQVVTAGNVARRYVLVDDDDLRTLPLPGGGTRSAFDGDGLVPGSTRGERWLFWPMGIASAGQMRQWGRHATAFVGRRHFDDPLLFDRYFERPAAAMVGQR
jgi:hypothetical protein